MFLKATIGRYAGEIREYSPEAARALLKSGSAIDPYAPETATPPRSSEAQPQQPRGRKGKSKHGRN